MSQQKALLLLAKQGSLEVGSRAIPTAEANQVLVKVTAAAINPAEWKIVDSGAFLDEFPAVLGVDAAGVVETVGSEVNHFKKGDRVFLEGRFKPYDFSAFQQYILADSELVSKTPSNISDDQAASIPLGAVTSISALFLQSGIAFPDNGPTATGKSIFITGGSTSVGQYAIQLARIAGFSPIGTTASPKHEEYLKSLGATHIFDRDVDAKAVQAAFPSGVSLVFDIVITSETKKLIFEILTTGSIVPDAHLAIAGRPDPALQEIMKDKVSMNFVFGDGYLYKHLSVPFWKVIGKWVEEGKIVPNRIQVVEGGLVGVPKALELSKKGVSAVKLVVHPQE